MTMRKTLPRSSACCRPACVSTPPHLRMRSASSSTGTILAPAGGASAAPAAVPVAPLLLLGGVAFSGFCPVADPSAGALLPCGCSAVGCMRHRSGFSCALRLTPAKTPPPCCNTVLMMRNFSRVSICPPPPPLMPPASLALSPPPSSSSSSRVSRRMVVSYSSCSCKGVFSLACFPLASLCLLKSASSAGSVTFIFIFCLGVRSPWRMIASTQRSSSVALRSSVRCASSKSRPGMSASMPSMLPRSFFITCASSSASPSVHRLDSAPPTRRGTGSAARRCGATMLMMMLRKMPAASSR
mmetsp:Transcript_25598/g.75673  ORF Transcript_25598/g.75673 Transcript_25598/m.75673 type:complete len:298 (+) Transcript_25598:3144-4037(+)